MSKTILASLYKMECQGVSINQIEMIPDGAFNGLDQITEGKATLTKPVLLVGNLSTSRTSLASLHNGMSGCQHQADQDDPRW